MRLSIDTISDLNFFETIFLKVKKFNKLNLNLLKDFGILQKLMSMFYKEK